MTYFFATIEQDACDVNPREDWEQLATLYTWHSRYTLGGKDDENNKSPIKDLEIWAFDYFNNLAKIPELSHVYSDYDSVYQHNHQDEADDEELNDEELRDFKKIVRQWLDDHVAILPVFMYDHSGITVRTHPFSCGWDSGQVGIIYLEKEVCEKNKIPFEDAEKILQQEVETLDQYLTGDVWYYSIYETNDEDYSGQILDHEDTLPDDRECVDSCGSYYSYNYCKTEVEAILLNRKVEI